MELPRSLQILREASAASGTAFEVVDTFTGFVARISRGKQSFLVGAAGIGVFPLNRAAPFAIARDKAFTHYVLLGAGFDVPAGGHFFVRPPEGYPLPPGRSAEDGIRFAGRLSDEFQKPLVVKPNSGKGAKHVVFAHSREALARAFTSIATIDNIALVQSLVDEPEFRLFLIDGEIAFAYRKLRPFIEGDGKKSIQALWQDKRHDEVPPPYFHYVCQRKNLRPDSILSPGERLEIDFIGNLAAGGQFAGFVQPTPQLGAWALRLAQTVSLRVTGIDVFSHSELRDPGDIIVTDVNGAPNLSTLYDLGHRDLVLAIWRRILDKAFSGSWPEGF